ncbi:MAG: cupredoxin domain-containing protein [Candidatus Micrarchaeota archaeon]
MDGKSSLALLLIAAAMLAGCTGNAAEAGNIESAAGSGNVKEFSVTAKQWEFSPSTLTVKKGDLVRITLTSADVTHGFMLPEFNINERIEPGKPVTVEFVADKAGEFGFRCSVRCGEGHMGQKGMLIVEE